MIVAKYFLGQS